VKTRSESV